MRSPQVLTCVEDYLAGKRYPLQVVTHLWPEKESLSAYQAA
jgi:hypothetical protein